jgi:hypothetical protein
MLQVIYTTFFNNRDNFDISVLTYAESSSAKFKAGGHKKFRTKAKRWFP